MKEIMDVSKMLRTIKRLTHEVIERHDDLSDLVILGIKKGGVPLAHELSKQLKLFSERSVPVFELDISSYRDDQKSEAPLPNVSLTDKVVILVDDVLFTGRTVRAAFDAIVDLGRPSKVELAVLIDRGHRELPIRANYIGKNLPTSTSESVFVDYTKGCFILDRGEQNEI
jgi:pyrimidine operon attenuation protein/uracil phosphoribosyltransferase